MNIARKKDCFAYTGQERKKDDGCSALKKRACAGCKFYRPKAEQDAWNAKHPPQEYISKNIGKCTTRGRRVSEKHKEAIIELWGKGISKTNIVEATGISYATVLRTIRNFEAENGKAD